MRGPQAAATMNPTVEQLWTEKERKEVQTMIKACIMTRKGGLPIVELRDEYRKCTDEDIPYARVGYKSLFHLVNDMTEISTIQNEDGVYVLVVTNPGKSGHIQQMVEKQKDPKIYKPRRSRDSVRQERQNREKTYRQSRYDEHRKESLDDEFMEERHPPVDENWDKPYINIEPDVYRKKMCTEPIIGSSQLIGDDYFLQLSIKYLSCRLERLHAKSGIVCGTVESGATIKKATKRLSNIEMLANKAVINLGTVDIYNRRSSDQMINDYTELLNLLENKLGFSPRRIVLCTLPPLANIGVFSHQEQYLNLLAFNSWIRNVANYYGYKLIDLFSEFTTEPMTIDYDYFQQDARMVSGTPHPHVLWNYPGRQKVMKLLLNV